MVSATRKTVVAIDGPAAAGKSTVARCLADRLRFRYISSGQLYRAASAIALRRCCDPTEEPAVYSALADADLAISDSGVSVGGRPLGAGVLYGPDVSRWIATHTAMRSVRLYINKMLLAAVVRKSCVIDGRDIGTIVFPDAEAKVFLDASRAERARRRQKQHGGDLQSVGSAINARDAADRGKEWGSLARASDAVFIDTTHLTVSEVCDKLFQLVRCRVG